MVRPCSENFPALVEQRFGSSVAFLVCVKPGAVKAHFPGWHPPNALHFFRLLFVRLSAPRRVFASSETVLRSVPLDRRLVGGPKMRAEITENFAALPTNTFPEARIQSECGQLGFRYKLPLGFVSAMVRGHSASTKQLQIGVVVIAPFFFHRYRD